MTPVEIDGARHSGSGTLLRFAVAFSGLTRRPLRIFNVRAARPKPGLRPQHVAAVRACAELCGARVEGLSVDSREVRFHPGDRVRGGDFVWEIGTAGSATMLALGMLPLACRAESRVCARISGGVFQDFAPSPFHMQHVLLPALGAMGVGATLRLVRAGYVPAGAGVIELTVEPPQGPLHALARERQGKVTAARGIAFASHLEERRVAERMALACEAELREGGVACAIERVDDREAARPGAGLAAWVETDTGCRIGADRAGAPRRTSESIGAAVARMLLEDLGSGATADRHLADQWILFAALARGITRYHIPFATDHVDSNLWLARCFGARAHREGVVVEIEGLGLS